jgi:hypothetical protein
MKLKHVCVPVMAAFFAMRWVGGVHNFQTKALR